MDREKRIKSIGGITKTGYYNENNEFILHSFDDEPCYIGQYGSKYWYKDGWRHRDFIIDENNKKHYLPAVIFNNGMKWYYDNGEFYYVVNDKRYKNEEYIWKKYRKLYICGYNENLEGYNHIKHRYKNKYYHLICDEIDRNEYILKYG